MSPKSSQLTTKDSQAGDLTYDEWAQILIRAFEVENTLDGYKSRAELMEQTKLTVYMLDKRLEILLKSGMVESGKGTRRGPAGLSQTTFVYRLTPKGKEWAASLALALAQVK